MSQLLTDGEKQTLLKIARESIELVVQEKTLLKLNIDAYPPALREYGASFVTLTIHHQLRGCIGTLEAYQPLIEDVREHAIAAALEDPRFLPIEKSELNRIRIEVSRLGAPQALSYESSEDLIKKLNPHIDGVIIKYGERKATFLPQVWEKIPNPSEFMNQLCYKMNGQANLWRETKLQVFTYQVEEFRELH
ncbi:MAG: AmmeMemoRadiSam system protein A [Anaerolineales bacterium]|nr:AmmeMemoRadiSam system protein A [Anaerolineales bacterium]